MSNSEASFYTLFTRSRFGRRAARDTTDADEESERVYDEAERYAVAAIAFCMRYDRDFKGHYWKAVTNKFQELQSIDLAKVTIEVEPKQCSDLLLCSPGNVLVVEHKLGAPLALHQDPSKEEFRNRNGAPRGYSVQMQEAHPGKKIYYVVLGKNFESQSPDKIERVDGIECTSEKWKVLLRSSPDLETDLEKDLYDCLGRLYVATFSLRAMSNDLELAKEAEGGARTYEMLGRVCENFSFKKGAMTKDDTGWAPSDFSFGISIFSDKSNSSSLIVQLVNPIDRKIGWIGYEKAPGAKATSLLVLLKCGDKASVERVRQRLQKFGESVIDDGLEIRVTRQSKESRGDELWFNEVFETLARSGEPKGTAPKN